MALHGRIALLDIGAGAGEIPDFRVDVREVGVGSPPQHPVIRLAGTRRGQQFKRFAEVILRLLARFERQ